MQIFPCPWCVSVNILSSLSIETLHSLESSTSDSKFAKVDIEVMSGNDWTWLFCSSFLKSLTHSQSWTISGKDKTCQSFHCVHLTCCGYSWGTISLLRLVWFAHNILQHTQTKFLMILYFQKFDMKTMIFDTGHFGNSSNKKWKRNSIDNGMWVCFCVRFVHWQKSLNFWQLLLWWWNQSEVVLCWLNYHKRGRFIYG